MQLLRKAKETLLKFIVDFHYMEATEIIRIDLPHLTLHGALTLPLHRVSFIPFQSSNYPVQMNVGTIKL
jgi:hypothetical protein